MNESFSIERISDEIQTLVSDYLQLIEKITKTPTGQERKSIFSIEINANEVFLLPATFQWLSKKTDHLQVDLQRVVRLLAQMRRNSILRPVENHRSFDKQLRLNRWNKNLKEQLQLISIDSSNKTLIRHLRAIIDAFDLLDEIIQFNDVFDKTFRLIGVFHNIYQQLNCLSTTIRRWFDENSLSIDEHLRKVKMKLTRFDEEMKKNEKIFFDRNVNSAVLVVRCPREKIEFDQ